MDLHIVFMILGFGFAAYSVVGNDVIQTLGTFISSNGKTPWYLLWAYTGFILTSVLFYGWYSGQGVAYGRLNKIPFPEVLQWWHVLPPLVLLIITRFGIPVSTTFLVLSVFATKNIGSMVTKSALGYLVAFGAAVTVYFLISRFFEENFIRKEIKKNEKRIWTVLQWISTGFLWSQWLIQDLANIYVYLPRGNDLSTTAFVLSMLMLVALLGYIFYSRGGKIQKIVTSKTNTTDIRSATIIDLIYGIVLFVFKEMSDIPMSTTWVFVGLLAGRELMINLRINMQAAFEARLKNEKKKPKKKGSLDESLDEEQDILNHPLYPRYSGTLGIFKMIKGDLLKVFAGLVVSLILVWLIHWDRMFEELKILLNFN
ncbi:MAG: hypothetical protein COZ18_16255 [Flexibacter sp. CG_4_10_14_3_um_filter_32_15]|nr:MAG: hypothetical protein COZ18_16255 [Flexibacter sp. CG_4_10_14_3_um_filter_32_15]